MTRERAKELAPIIQAYGEGKSVQWKRSTGEWVDSDGINCSDGNSGTKYRIKPEPVTRPMTRGEVLYEITGPEHRVIRNVTQDIKPLPTCYLTWPIEEYEYAIIDKHGEPVSGWHKFEIEA